MELFQRPATLARLFFRGPLALTFLFVMSTASASQVTDCDLLAAHPDDPRRIAPGVERQDIDLKAAEGACRSAYTRRPDHAQTNYQLGRVLYYQGRVEESLPFLQHAAATGYPQAIFVLGYVHTRDNGLPIDFCKAGSLWLRAARLDHPWSGYYLVVSALDGHFNDCDFSITADDLRYFSSLAVDQITFAASAGRVEKMLARLQQYLDGLDS